eukprot:CAMPEP_0184983352 /NCGR_PEP_ID=MMETSP1098-20130426/12587_1 /TAXON_ID=89044 /ORGANISM="Spumella elongata, Strain CCAP 955/1" /LENGTH=753 /DNA_ID=CAMNT_0027507163 /DNA_START=177 /DNA_END=2435 /DNA_ORIENTATION=-
MKDHIKILLVGDEGVGKSSLISAYISQHFPQEVPPVMTDTVLPPEATTNEVCVTIMDSSSHINDRDVLRQKIINADSIIALYDVTRPETLDSISNFWLPLITDLSTEPYKPVILVGNKTDLLAEEIDTEQLNNLFAAFPSVMNCWDCSAANIQNLDTAFHMAMLFVNYPLSYIYDMTEDEFLPAARRAFLRIFRIFDVDGDNLLSDAELSDTQLRCFEAHINSDEIMALKSQIATRVPGGVVNNCVAFEGFLGLMKMNVESNNYQIPWLVLRSFNYDDNLNIVIPEEITQLPELRPNQVTELSSSARTFLLNLAQIAYNECERPLQPESTDRDGENSSGSELEETLTWDALKIVLSVLSAETEDPWSDPPSFKAAWRHDESVEQRILLRGLSHIGATLSFDDWIAHWSLLALNEPAVTQMLLFKLGYVERIDLGLVASSGPMVSVQNQELLASTKPSFFSRMFYATPPEHPQRRSTLQVCVLGDNGVGKSSFVWYLTGLRAPGIGGEVEMGIDYAKYSDCIVVGGCALKSNGDIESDKKNRSPVVAHLPKAREELLQAVLTPTYHLSVAAVPLDQVEKWLEHCVDACDLVVLMFQCGKPASLTTCKALESRLPECVPRLYLASKSDLIFTSPALQTAHVGSSGSLKGEYGNETQASRKSLKAAHESVLQQASLHIRERNLPALTMFSTLTGEGMADATSLVVDVVTDPAKGLPQTKTKPSPSFALSRPAMIVSVAAIIGAVLVAQFEKEVKAW